MTIVEQLKEVFAIFEQNHSIMKRISFLLFLVFFVDSYGQNIKLKDLNWTRIDYYTITSSSYSEPGHYTISASRSNGEFNLKIEIRGHRIKSPFPTHPLYAYLILTGKERIFKFVNSLRYVCYKYEDWLKIAKENKIDDFNKQFDVDFPPVHIAWDVFDGISSRKIFYDYDVNMAAHFSTGLLREDCPFIVKLICKPFTKIDDGSESYCLFNNVQEMDTFISIIEGAEKKLDEIEKEKQRKDNLFK